MHAMQQCWVHATHLDVVPLIPQLHHTLPKTFVSGLLPCTSRRVRGKAHAGRQGRHLQWSTSCTDVGLMTANCFQKCCDVRSPLAMMKSLRVAALLPLDPPIPVRLKAVPQFGNGWRTSPPGKCRTAICQSSKEQCKSDEVGLLDRGHCTAWNLGCSWCMMPAQQVGFQIQAVNFEAPNGDYGPLCSDALVQTVRGSVRGLRNRSSPDSSAPMPCAHANM